MNFIYNWQPNATIINLKKRSLIISKIRKFFFKRNVLEVETPCLSKNTVTDVNICSFKTKYFKYGKKYSKTLYLNTSPEFHMKRLLAAGIGAIYQICHVFRNEEFGRYHNPEFTMLEWYRPSYNMYNLMEEVNALFKYILKCKDADILSYQQIFMNYLKIDPLSNDETKLFKIAEKFGIKNVIPLKKENKDSILQLLFTLGIESKIGKKKPIFIYHFPASQAALSTINQKDKRVSERFEVYYKNIEIANGFFELTNEKEQKKRFDLDNVLRKKANLPKQKIDLNFLNALNYGLPNCSGVALGIDRLIMLALNTSCIQEVLSFSVEKS